VSQNSFVVRDAFNNWRCLTKANYL